VPHGVRTQPNERRLLGDLSLLGGPITANGLHNTCHASNRPLSFAMSLQDEAHTPSHSLVSFPPFQSQDGEEECSEHTSLVSKIQKTPLPKLQLFAIYFIQFCEPVTAVVIYPFAPQLVRRTGITGGDEKKTGYYTGIIVSRPVLSSEQC
jgi:hypothetical protein